MTNVANAISATESTVRPGRAAALICPKRQSARAVGEGVGMAGARRSQSERPVNAAISAAPPAPKKPAVAFITPAAEAAVNASARTAKMMNAMRRRAAAGATRRRCGGRLRLNVLHVAVQQRARRHARHAAQCPRDREHRGDDAAGRADQQ